MKCVYPACFYMEDGGRYSVIFPDFPLATYGNDLADALYMAQEAAGRIIGLLEDGEPLPMSSQVNDVFLEKPDGFVSLIYVALNYFKALFDEKPVKKTLTIPSWLNSAAVAKKINFSATLKDALLEKNSGVKINSRAKILP